MNKRFTAIAATALSVCFSGQSFGVLVSADISSDGQGANTNDCSGFFGQGFDNCVIFVGEGDDRVEFSPVIAKYDVDGDDWEINEVYDAGENPPGSGTVDGSEFTINGSAGNSGTWSYTPDNPEDPAVRYWVGKGGNGAFRLHWDVDQSQIDAGNCFSAAGNIANYNAICLGEANIVQGGDWATATGQGLSHITFYDTAAVPIPAAAWLFGTGLLGLAGIGKRRAAK